MVLLDDLRNCPDRTPRCERCSSIAEAQLGSQWLCQACANQAIERYWLRLHWDRPAPATVDMMIAGALQVWLDHALPTRYDGPLSVLYRIQNKLDCRSCGDAIDSGLYCPACRQAELKLATMEV